MTGRDALKISGARIPRATMKRWLLYHEHNMHRLRVIRKTRQLEGHFAIACRVQQCECSYVQIPLGGPTILCRWSGLTVLIPRTSLPFRNNCCNPTHNYCPLTRCWRWTLFFQLILRVDVVYTGRSDVTQSAVTIRSPSCGYNTI